jgi:hypothetical protein
MDKPQDCIICLEVLNEQHSLECGHWIHISCIQKQFKPECPLCRHPLKIMVHGKLEIINNYIIDEDSENSESNESVLDDVDNNIDDVDVDSQEIDYDEDNEDNDDNNNPHGDDWYYEYV